VRITAAGGEGDEVDVTIAGADGGPRHYHAVVRLCAPGAARAVTAPARLPDDLAPFPMGMDEAYRDLLFHGPRFRGIAAIEGMDERGARALLRTSTPDACLAGDAPHGPWLLDPVLLDSALQVQVLWARLHWDVTLLPAEIRAHDRAVGGSFADLPAGALVRHELRVRPGSRAPLCHADHRFTGPDGRLLATLTDVVGVGTKALNRLAAASA
jgi:hypothetical protein